MNRCVNEVRCLSLETQVQQSVVVRGVGVGYSSLMYSSRCVVVCWWRLGIQEDEVCLEFLGGWRRVVCLRESLRAVRYLGNEGGWHLYECRVECYCCALDDVVLENSLCCCRGNIITLNELCMALTLSNICIRLASILWISHKGSLLDCVFGLALNDRMCQKGQMDSVILHFFHGFTRSLWVHSPASSPEPCQETDPASGPGRNFPSSSLPSLFAALAFPFPFESSFFIDFLFLRVPFAYTGIFCPPSCSRSSVMFLSNPHLCCISLKIAKVFMIVNSR